jgi:hypothetical protein
VAVAEFQNNEYVVWSGVRAVLPTLPIVFTSLKSLVYRPLVSGGGAAGRSARGEPISHGTIFENCR